MMAGGRRRASVAGAAAACAICAWSSAAAQVEPGVAGAELGGLVRDASRIVVGRVVSVERETDTGGPAELVTATFAVEQTIKGPDDAILSVRFYAVDSRLQAAAGRGELTPEERAEYGDVELGEPGADPARPAPDAARAARAGHRGRPDPGLSFRRGERLLLFLPEPTPLGLLRPSDPGFAKLRIVSLGGDGVASVVPAYGMRLERDVPRTPQQAESLETLLLRIEALGGGEGAR